MKDSFEKSLQLIVDNIDQIEISEDPESADILICPLASKPLLMPDNLVAHCSKCFRLVQHRPHVPKTPQKLCVDCAKKSIKKDDDPRLFITKDSIDDIVSQIKKKVTN